MSRCNLSSWICAPLRWIMYHLTKQGSYVTKDQSGDLSRVINYQDSLMLQEKDCWWIEAQLWPEFAGKFGFEMCGQVHLNEREPFYSTLCDKGVRQWPGPVPNSSRSMYKVKLMHLSVTNPHGIREEHDENSHMKHPFLRVTNSPKCSKRYHLCLESRYLGSKKRIAIPVPWEPQRIPLSQTYSTRYPQVERYVVVAYSKIIGVILEMANNGSQKLHVVNLLAELYQGCLAIRGYIHSYISADNKLLIVGDFLASRQIVWKMFKIGGDALTPIGKLNGYEGIQDWYVYSMISFQPNAFGNRFVLGGACITTNRDTESALCSFCIDENNQIQSLHPPVFINYQVSSLGHSPDGLLVFGLGDERREIYLYKSKNLEQLKIISQSSVPYPLPRKEVFLMPRLHFSANWDPTQPFLFKMYKWTSGCNDLRFSRGGVFLSIATCDRGDPNKICRRIILRVPLTRVLTLKEFCKRQTMQMISHDKVKSLPLPEQVKNYLLI